MNRNTICVGDAREVMREWPAESVQCAVTSPPYYQLRDYGVAGQLGLEATPDDYVDKLVAVLEEVRRVLRPDGTLWLNLNDSYSDGRIGREDGGRTAIDGYERRGADPCAKRRVAGAKKKNLLGIPWTVALALRNAGWYLRQEIIWSKPNAMPESVRDRPTRSHETLFLLSKSAQYYYDAEAVKEPCRSGPADVRKMLEKRDRISGKHLELTDTKLAASTRSNIGRKRGVGDPSGRNLRSVWNIATTPYHGAHFATFPEKLVQPCVLAGTSAGGECAVCGSPTERIVEKLGADREHQAMCGSDANGEYHGVATKDFKAASAQDASAVKARILRGMVRKRTIGWRKTCRCKCVDTKPSLVLDPFMGAGTTAVAAMWLGRDFMGCELNPAYRDLALRRIEIARAEKETGRDGN